MRLVKHAEAALQGADALLVVTEWKEFRTPDFDAIKAALKQPVIFDGRNLYDPKLMKALGHGRGYRYAHDEADGFAAGERYWPDGLEPPPQFYQPVPRGLELRISEKLAELRRLNEEARQGPADTPVADDEQ